MSNLGNAGLFTSTNISLNSSQSCSLIFLSSVLFFLRSSEITFCKCFLLVCPFVSNKRQNGWTDRAQFFVEPHTIPGKLYGRSKSQKFVSKSNFFYFENARTQTVTSANYFSYCFLLHQLFNRFLEF